MERWPPSPAEREALALQQWAASWKRVRGLCSATWIRKRVPPSRRGSASPTHISCPADVSQEMDAARFIEETVSRFGRIDVLVNNAAIRNYVDVTEASAESWDRVLGVNLKGFAFCAKAAIAAMKNASGGVVVNLASVRSLVAGLKCVQYDTTKAAILGLTRSMARDHAADKVRVMAVGPGPIFTDFHEKRAEELGQTNDEYKNEFGTDTMLNRPGAPVEVANVILFVASDEASFMTGTCVFVDGGQTGL